eukprot:COSAG02_NODE_1835_length_10714_cov_7.585437_7_plen_218_part_00
MRRAARETLNPSSTSTLNFQMETNDDKTSTVMIINVYMPHRRRKRKSYFEDTLQQLESLVQAHKNEHIIICGDFNASVGRNEPGATGAYANRKSTVIDNDHMNERNMEMHQKSCKWQPVIQQGSHIDKAVQTNTAPSSPDGNSGVYDIDAARVGNLHGVYARRARAGCTRHMCAGPARGRQASQAKTTIHAWRHDGSPTDMTSSVGVLSNGMYVALV